MQNTIGDYFPPGTLSADDSPVILGGDTQAPSPDPEKQPESATQPPVPARPERVVAIRNKPARAGMPDVGVAGVHTVVQGLVTYKPKKTEYALAPWQVLPFSDGYEFIAEALDVRFHRGVYQVGLQGDFFQEGPASPLGFVRNSWAYVTQADSICGFSGFRFNRNKLTVESMHHIYRDMTQDGEEDRPWSSDAYDQNLTMASVLPKFWVELDNDPGTHLPEAPLETKVDVTTGEKLKLVPLEKWHLLAPIPGVHPDLVKDCVREHGDRFLLNRIYISGTGWKTGSDEGLQSDEPLLLEDLTNPVTNNKLISVLLPCLKAERSDAIQHELFSRSSATALRNLLGDRAVIEASVFAK